MRAAILSLLLLVGGASPALAVQPAPENVALALAWQDVQQLDPVTRLFTRYVWIDDGSQESYQAVSLTVNDLSLNAIAAPVPAIGQGRTVLVRVDLRALVLDETQLKTLVKTWEEFRFDPKFSLLITRDTLKFLEIEPVVTDWIKETVPAYQAADGKTYTARWAKRQVLFSKSSLDVLRLVSEHIDQQLAADLAAATRTECPVVHFRYFVVRALSTIKGKGLFRTIYGGLYYELAGVPRKAKRATDLDELLESLGISGDFRKLFDRLRSDQRVAVFRSGVTGKPRQAEVLPTLLSRDGKSIVSVTNDIGDADIDIGSHPVMNLLAFKVSAHEVIWTRANGLHGYALYNAAGALQEEVPPDIANDSTIPAPHTQRLQAAIGCKRCHRSEGGWRLLKNDVTALTRVLDIFGDTSDRRRDPVEQVERLRGLYAGNMERILLPRARDDFANAVLQAGGPWKASKDQLDVVQLALGRQGDIYREYVYDLVDARKALTELGIVAELGPIGKPHEQLKALFPVPPEPVQFDPRIGGLLAELSIGRADWDLVRNFVATKIAKEKR